MKRNHPNLCKPITLGRTTLRNRMCSVPMGATDITAEGTPGPRTQGFYELRAKGGAAVVTVSELTVHPETDGSEMLRLSLDTPGQLAAFTYVADAIKRHGAVPSIELSHSGQYAGTYMVDKSRQGELVQYGPSNGVRTDGMKVKALTSDQIADIVAAYANAAALARRAGFEMIMVHAGHGWLLNQFLSPYFNKRNDEYGGSLENRVRIVREVLQAIRSQIGPFVPIELRMSGAEMFDGGYDVDEGCRIASAVEDLVDLIHVSAGSYQFGFSVTHPPMFVERGSNVHLAAAVKKHVSVPVACVGGLADPDQMEQIIASGQADIVVMGRALLADPELPNKVMSNKADEIIRCLRCYVCMAERPATQTRRCAVNPRIGRELEGMGIARARERKCVLVVGGGIAGLTAARVAALRGHEVVLCEKEQETGGILRLEGAIPFKMDMYRLGQTCRLLAERAGAEIRYGTEVDAGYAGQFGADAVIVAVGSAPIPLPIPRDEGGPDVLDIEELYLDGAQVGSRVVVMGGGLTGSECALNLAQQGKTVHIVEMRDGLAIDANIRNRPILLKLIEEAGVAEHVLTRAERVTGNGLLVSRDGMFEEIPADTIICAIGQRSRADVAEALRDAAPFVRIVGDARRPANVVTAVYEAYHAALDI